MSSSAITTQVAQLKIGNVQNQADTSAVYSAGVWSFKNSTALTSVTITDAGNVGVGTANPGARLDVASGEIRSGGSVNAGAITLYGGGSGAILDIRPNTISGANGVTYNTSFVSGGTGPHVFSTGGTERMRIDSSGSVILGTSTIATTHLVQGNYNDAAGVLDVRNFNTNDAAACMRMYTYATGTTTANKFCNFLIGGVVTSGSIAANGANAATFSTYSDRRLKENILPLSGELSKILALNPIEFDYKTGGHQIGFIAQEIEEVYPDAVSYVGPETEVMKEVGGWDKTAARLVKAIQELSAKVDFQDREIRRLKGEVVEEPAAPAPVVEPAPAPTVEQFQSASEEQSAPQPEPEPEVQPETTSQSEPEVQSATQPEPTAPTEGA